MIPNSKKSSLFFGVQDVPPITTALLFGIQQVLVCASGVISIPFVVSDLLCASNNALARVKLLGTTLFATGFSTIVQCTFGVRLPLLQGPSFAFFAPILAFINLPEFKCPNLDRNVTANMTQEQMDDLWMSRMTIIQGALIASAAVEIFIGLTGLIGVITRFIGPLTIAPLMISLELSVVQVCLQYCAKHWSSLIATVLLLTTVLYLHCLKTPICGYNQGKGCFVKKFPVFAVFPYLIAISVVWVLCYVLTVAGVFEPGSPARTDLRSYVITEAPWFRWPYPGQWGRLRFNAGVFLGMLAATFTSVVESVGAYHAAARVCEERPPPSHAVNRGVLMEGLCCLFGSALGGSVSVTTYSENIGVIGITKVASRRTMQFCGLTFVILGLFTKFGAVLATLPDPIVGGIFSVSLSIVGGVGLSSLQLVDLQSSRNTAVLGLAIMFGALVPAYIEKYPIRTGATSFDQLINILLSIQIFVGGMTGFILDNTVPGATPEQRGLNHHVVVQQETTTDCEQQTGAKEENLHNTEDDPYTFPPYVMNVLEKIPYVQYVPFLPTFAKNNRSYKSNHVAPQNNNNNNNDIIDNTKF